MSRSLIDDRGAHVSVNRRADSRRLEPAAATVRMSRRKLRRRALARLADERVEGALALVDVAEHELRGLASDELLGSVAEDALDRRLT